MPETAEQLHARLVSEIIERIVREPLDRGGDVVESLVILESVILGVLMAAAPGLEGDLMSRLGEGIKARLSEITQRKQAAEGLAKAAPAGHG